MADKLVKYTPTTQAQRQEKGGGEGIVTEGKKRGGEGRGGEGGEMGGEGRWEGRGDGRGGEGEKEEVERHTPSQYPLPVRLGRV